MMRMIFTWLFLFAAVSPALAKLPALVLRGPTWPVWAENEVGYEWGEGGQMTWRNGSYLPPDCQDCELVYVAELRFPVPAQAGIPQQSLLIPTVVWQLPQLFAADSAMPFYREQGQWLAEQLRALEDVDASIGIGDATQTSPTSYFPQDYYPVGTGGISVGALKGRYRDED